MFKYYKGIVLLAVCLFTGAGTAQALSVFDDGDRIVYLADNPNLVRGENAYDEGNYELSIKLFTRALDSRIKGKQLASVHNAICAANNALGNHHEALKQCSLALESENQYWMAFINRGNANKALGHKKEAYKDYCLARDIAPNKVSGSFTQYC